MCCFKIYPFSFHDGPQGVEIIITLHLSTIFPTGTRKFHAGLGPVGPYVATGMFYHSYLLTLQKFYH